jgi:hypothetical protein
MNSMMMMMIFVSLAYPPELDYKHLIETEASLTTIMDDEDDDVYDDGDDDDGDDDYM